MITDKMKEYIEAIKRNQDGTPIKSSKYSIYKKRIQVQINHNLKMGQWLAENHPDILLDEEREYTEASGKIGSNRRIKQLVQIIMTAKPKMQCELVLKKFLEELGEE